MNNITLQKNVNTSKHEMNWMESDCNLVKQFHQRRKKKVQGIKTTWADKFFANKRLTSRLVIDANLLSLIKIQWNSASSERPERDGEKIENCLMNWKIQCADHLDVDATFFMAIVPDRAHMKKNVAIKQIKSMTRLSVFGFYCCLFEYAITISSKWVRLASKANNTLIITLNWKFKKTHTHFDISAHMWWERFFSQAASDPLYHYYLAALCFLFLIFVKISMRIQQ